MCNISSNISGTVLFVYGLAVTTIFGIIFDVFIQALEYISAPFFRYQIADKVLLFL